MSSNALVPVEQKQVLFYEDEITAVLVQDGAKQEIYIPLRPICDYLGLDWSAQYRRINRDPVLMEALQGVAVMATPSPDGRGGGLQNTLCLPLKFLPGWLFGVSASRVKEDLRQKIIRYQRECYDVLWEAFGDGRLAASGDDSFDDLLRSGSEAVEAYRMLQAMIKLARNQIIIEARLESYGGRLDDYEKRLDNIEATLGDPGQFITPDQASQISQAVKAVALELGKRSKKNEYGGVYGQMYRKFGIAGYKQLPANQFEAAMRWLTDWYKAVTGATGSESPF
jgi:hypothetical protein